MERDNQAPDPNQTSPFPWDNHWGAKKFALATACLFLVLQQMSYPGTGLFGAWIAFGCGMCAWFPQLRDNLQAIHAFEREVTGDNTVPAWEDALSLIIVHLATASILHYISIALLDLLAHLGLNTTLPQPF